MFNSFEEWKRFLLSKVKLPFWNVKNIPHEKVDILESLSKQGMREYSRTGKINPRAASIIEN